MLFSNYLTILRGGGDLATGVAYRLHQAGFPIIVLELEQPLVIRRQVAFATAVLAGSIKIEGVQGTLCTSVSDAVTMAHSGQIAVLASPQLPNQLKPTILVDCRMAKRNIDTTITQADLVIALGPGFTAGIDVHAVIETMRGHRLGRVIWDGSALPNSGIPGAVAGKGAERVLRAPANGNIQWQRKIGDLVEEGDKLGSVSEIAITAPFSGVIRGLIADKSTVKIGLKVGDIDARADVDACFTISDKALSIGGGVVEAVLTQLNRQELA